MSAACDKKVGEAQYDLIPESDFIDLMIEFELIKTRGQIRKDTLGSAALTAEVLKKYGISQQQFEASHRFYQHDPELYKRLSDTAVDRLKNETDALKAVKPAPQETPDS